MTLAHNDRIKLPLHLENFHGNKWVTMTTGCKRHCFHKNVQQGET